VAAADGVGGGETLADTRLADDDASGDTEATLLDGEAGTIDTMVVDALDSDGVTDANGLALTRVVDGDDVGKPDPVAAVGLADGETVALADELDTAEIVGVGLAATTVVAVEGMGDTEVDDGMTDAEGVIDSPLLLAVVMEGIVDARPDVDGVALPDGDTVGEEDMLTDGVALIDTMLTDTDGERELEGVGERDTRLGEGELVSDADPLADGEALGVAVGDRVALTETMVVDADGLEDREGVIEVDGLALTRAADGNDGGKPDPVADGVGLADGVALPGAPVELADETVALANALGVDGEKVADAGAVAGGVLLADPMTPDGDPLADKEGVTDAEGLVLTMLADDDADGADEYTLLNGDAVVHTEGVLDSVALPPLADGEGELVGVALVVVAPTEGVIDNEELADGEPDTTAGVGVVVMVLADGDVVRDEEMLTNGVAVIDPMLADTVEETDAAGVVDEVGEVDVRLGEGELVNDAEALRVGVALAVATVPDAEAAR
jgi:hypothetical protein